VRERAYNARVSSNLEMSVIVESVNGAIPPLPSVARAVFQSFSSSGYGVTGGRVIDSKGFTVHGHRAFEAEYLYVSSRRTPAQGTTFLRLIALGDTLVIAQTTAFQDPFDHGADATMRSDNSRLVSSIVVP